MNTGYGGKKSVEKHYGRTPDGGGILRGH